MSKDSNQVRKRIKDTIPHLVCFLLLVLCLHFFGRGNPWSWQEILISLPMLIILYLIELSESGQILIQTEQRLLYINTDYNKLISEITLDGKNIIMYQ